MINRLLIANRGEIACRIIATAKRLGITTIAIYSDSDRGAQHVCQADEAYHVGPAPSQESYLNIDNIIKVAKLAKADAIHPGYGFLSENTQFAQRLTQENIIFIGPKAASIAAMGSKAQAKHIMGKANIPLVPGYHDEAQDEATLAEAANKIGYPVLLKAASGGGGKGMRIVHQQQDFSSALASAKREALKSFSDDRIIIEKYIVEPRHVEIQVFADEHGNVIHLFERDCSIQRRYQKIIEEAPAPNLSDELRQTMGATACAAAKAIDYVGAGTIEFLLAADKQFYFMEMNTRLQVEHPVTEKITGLDLVEWQIRVANHEVLPLTQQQISCHGHAFEVRIYAEDPSNDFLPATGRIHYLQQPLENQHVRIDTGITEGDEISIYYDPMISKLIVWDRDRDRALRRLQTALRQYHVAGLNTNLSFLRTIAANTDIAQAKLSTHFIEQHYDELLASQLHDLDLHMIMACLSTLRPNPQNASPFATLDAWQMNLPAQYHWRLFHQQQTIDISAKRQQKTLHFTIADRQFAIEHITYEPDCIRAEINQQYCLAKASAFNDHIIIICQDRLAEFQLHNADNAANETEGNDNLLTSPMPGTVIAVMANSGQDVAKGDDLIIMEAMKMEHTIKAPFSGKIKAIHYKIGDQVAEGMELLELEEA